ncbi:unnamed protein product, partial [marine sediment metagenome]
MRVYPMTPVLSRAELRLIEKDPHLSKNYKRL